MIIRRQDVFVGRQGVLRQRQVALPETVAGRGRVVWRTGEPGIGKTRTAMEFTAAARKAGAWVLWGACYAEVGLAEGLRFASGRAAAQARTRIPSIISSRPRLDCGHTGTELIRRTIAPYPDLIRIILTGYTDVGSLIEAINAGRVYRYLTKPWKAEDLCIAVRQGLDVYRLATDNLRLQEELRQANEKLRVENTLLRRDARGRHRFDEIIGASPALQKTLDLVDRSLPATRPC
ncbi:MAG: AAA family ATPase [Deltaproteobacteria bacterium]|nr:AAA family ATPase [Deltaproteobacteria bacterium]